MKKSFWGILFGVGIIGWGAYSSTQLWDQVQAMLNPPKSTNQVHTVRIDELGLLPAKVEEELARAQKEGAPGLKAFLTKYSRSSPMVLKDPRRAWIQLDYAALVAFSDIAEARKVFNEVSARLKPGSPAYDKMKRLEPNLK